MGLTRHDLEDMQAYIDFAIDRFGGHGLTLHSSGDMTDFAQWIASQEDSFGASASHNPVHSFLTPENAFWIWLEEEDGTRVASTAQKLVRTESFIEHVYSHRLYDSQAPVLDARIPECFDGVDEEELAFSGNISYGSGLYVRPDYRGRGFLILACVARTLGIRYFEADWVVAIQRYHENSHIRSLKPQLYAHCIPFVKGMPYKWDGEFQISWSSRDEWLQAIRMELLNVGITPRGPIHSPDDHRQEEAAGRSRA
jgi:GNAT superfamily N-acetyltransferase